MGRVFLPLISVILVLSGVLWLIKSGQEQQDAELAAISESLQKYASPNFNPEIRVHLATRSSVPFQVKSSYVVYSLKTGKEIARGKNLSESDLQASGNQIKAGSQNFKESSVEIRVEKSPSLWVNEHCYHGKLRVYKRSGGKIEVINVVPMRDYIASVTDSEMPGDFPGPMPCTR